MTDPASPSDTSAQPAGSAARPIIIIPSRLASTRLPNKPLADICGEPMIVQVWRRAMEADIGPVIVACDGPEIADAVRAAGGDAVITRADHPSGSDRIHEAVSRIDASRQFNVVVNVQGDLPTIAPEAIRAAFAPLENPAVDIATLTAPITLASERTNPAIVKVVGTEIQPRRLRALYFTRCTAPYGEGPLFHHIGLYAYRRTALERFVGLPPSPLEQRERLEQLRALEAGMRIDVEIVDDVPLGVDTNDELEQARAILRTRLG